MSRLNLGNVFFIPVSLNFSSYLPLILNRGKLRVLYLFFYEDEEEFTMLPTMLTGDTLTIIIECFSVPF